MSDESKTKVAATPKVEVKVTTTKEEPKGLAADAKKAKEQYAKQDEAQAEEHAELRETDKIVVPTPLIGYETARENLYVEEGERVEPEMPKPKQPQKPAE